MTSETVIVALEDIEDYQAFEAAVIEASRLFGAEPYMSEAAYRAELARGLWERSAALVGLPALA